MWLRHRWPRRSDLVIEELYINDNGLRNHVHIASKNRRQLIRLAEVAIHHFGAAGMVREFPPFDRVECVHTSGSWHYRDSHSPLVSRSCSDRGNGLAFDLGCARREEFARKVKERYRVKESDF